MQVIEGGDNALVIMETVLRFPDGKGGITEMSRRAPMFFDRKATVAGFVPSTTPTERRFWIRERSR
jgi:hypothetical protein